MVTRVCIFEVLRHLSILKDMPINPGQKADSQEVHTEKDDDDGDLEFVEVDPTKRYGRYDAILGEGAFKTVYRAFDTIDGIEVAWNQVKVQDAVKNSKDLERLHSEVNLLKTLKHKNIIKFYDSWVDARTKNVNFITEIFTSGNLRQYRRKHKHVDMKAVKSWARQILRGLLYLHSHDPPIIHRDIKCDNIFINGNNGEVKIGDLGLAVVLQQTRAAHSVIGTPEFMAPELYEEDYTELVDIYSFGMCVLELITLEYPYSECHNAAQIFKKVTSGKKPAALAKVRDPELRRFVEQCLANVNSRLPARDLLNDPFLQTVEAMEPVISLHPRRSQSGCNGVKALGTILEEPVKAADDQAEKNKNAHSSDQALGSSVCGSPKMDMKNSRKVEEISIADWSGSSSENIQELRSMNLKGDISAIKLIIRLKANGGHSRAITFNFNIEADSALAVASEMIAELGLFDEDVVEIAEQIDSELLTLVPNWKPGAAFDETIDEGNCLDQVVNEAGDLKLLTLVPDWKQDNMFDEANQEKKHMDELLDADGGIVQQTDSQVKAFSSKGPRLELLSSSLYFPVATSFDSTLSFDSPTVHGQVSLSSHSLYSEKHSPFSADIVEAKQVGDVKHLIIDLNPSNAVNFIALDKVKLTSCSYSDALPISSNADAAIAVKIKDPAMLPRPK